MQRRLRFAAVALATAVMTAGGMGVLAPAAHAAPGDTTVTFSISGGALSITVPSSATLGGVSTGAGSTFGSLGNTTVTDNRGALAAAGNWTVTVTNPTVFSTGGASTNEKIAADHVYYCSGTATGSGLGAFVPTGLSGAACTTTIAAQVGTGVTGASWTNVAGNSSQQWNPTLLLSLLSSQVAGSYSGTVNQSVA